MAGGKNNELIFSIDFIRVLISQRIIMFRYDAIKRGKVLFEFIWNSK